MRIRNWLVGFLALGFVFAIAGSSWGVVPSKINVQGRLQEGGAAVEAGESRDMTFTIYELDGMGGHSNLWTKTQSVTMGNNGVFNVILEDPPALEDQFFRRPQPIFLEISIGGAALEPAQELVSVPFAITSLNLDGGTVNARNSLAMAIVGEVTGGTNAAIQGNHMAGGQGVRGSSPSGHGVYGTSGSSGVDANAGVFGWNTAGTDGGPGVRGVSISGRGVEGLSEFSGDSYYNRPAAVYGENSAETAGGSGVRGYSRSGIGVFGETRGDDEFAGYFWGSGSTSKGLYGFSTNSTGIVGSSVLDTGVKGITSAENRPAIRAENTSSGSGIYATSDTGHGVRAESSGTGLFSAVTGINSSTGIGVSGVSNTYGVAGAGNTIGVSGFGGVSALGVPTVSGVGIYGSGVTAGGHFESEDGYGIYAETGSDSGDVKAAVHAKGGHLGLFAETENRSVGTALVGRGGFIGVIGLSGPGDEFPDMLFSAPYGGYFRAQPHVGRALGIEGDAWATGRFRAGESLDIAEWVKVNDLSIEKGDVLVLDKNNAKSVVKSNGAYSALVAGIVSTKPALLAGGHEEKDEILSDEKMEAKGYRMLALAGQVPCKVSAENGPIEVGDLLTTSNTPGHAMKATDPKVGTIVGKAMEPLASGKGKIMVLVTLQ